MNPATLKADLIALYSDCDEDMTPSIFAERMAAAIDSYIKTATVTTTVAGSAAGITPGPSAAVVSGTGTGTLS